MKKLTRADIDKYMEEDITNISKEDTPIVKVLEKRQAVGYVIVFVLIFAVFAVAMYHDEIGRVPATIIAVVLTAGIIAFMVDSVRTSIKVDKIKKWQKHELYRSILEQSDKERRKEMITTKTLSVNGKDVQGVCITAPGGEGHPNMLVLVAEKGYIMCGYLNLEAAERFGDAACVIGGSSFEEQLANPVKAVTTEAAKLGVEIGMTGAEVCTILND